MSNMDKLSQKVKYDYVQYNLQARLKKNFCFWSSGRVSQKWATVNFSFVFANEI